MELKIFLIGVLAGMAGGALIVANSATARKIVKEKQEEVVEKAEELTKKYKQPKNKTSLETEGE